MDDRLDDLRIRLEAIAEELADLAIDALRRATGGDDGPDPDAVATERKLTRARRAVAKAAALLDEREAFDDD